MEAATLEAAVGTSINSKRYKELLEKQFTVVVLELLGTKESVESIEAQQTKLALLFTTAMKELLVDNHLLRELIWIDAVEAVRFQKDDIQSLITKNLGTKDIRSLINAIATKACNSFAAS